MAKYIIKAKTEFTGLGAGELPFVNGVAETENEWIATWHESSGYEVEVEGGSEPELTVPQLKALADEKGIEYPANIKKADLIKLLEEQE